MTEAARVFTAWDSPNARATLDGEDVSDICTAACPDEGWVELLIWDDGDYLVGEYGYFATRRRYGKVTVEIPE